MENSNYNNQIDDAIKKANTSEDLNTVSDAEVGEARTQAGETGRDTIEQVTDNVAANTDAANAGAPGSKVSNLFKNIAGKPQAVSTSAAMMQTRGVTPMGGAAMPTDYIMSDVDHLERNAGLAAGAIESVHATVLRQATRGTTNGDQAIIGTPADNNVYSEETDVTAETVTGKTVLYPAEQPRHRAQGTFLKRSPQVVSISGDYLFADEYGDSSHEAQKGVLDRENLLFNLLNRDGGISRASYTHTSSTDVETTVANSPAFVMPKRGRFWLRGINVAPTQPNKLSVAGFVARTDADGNRVNVPVLQARSGDCEGAMFDVVDLTSFLSDMRQATAETAALLTANKSKFTLGQCEQIAQLFATSQSIIDTPDEVATWPEFANIGRSSLTHVSTDSADNRAYCFNDYESYIELMHYLEESEIMFGLHRINAHNWRENLKFHKNMEGQNAAYPYWRNKFQGDPQSAGGGHADLGTVPNIKHYAATKASHRAFNTMGKWLYTFRTFWSDLESYCATIDEGAAKDAIMSKIRIQRDAVNQITSALQLGRASVDTGETSDTLAFAPNTVDIILGFDPNDFLIGEVTSGRAHMYPSCGYYNVFTRNNAQNASTVVYDICPMWMSVYMHAANSQAFTDRLLLAGERAENSIRPFFQSGGFMPVQFDTFSPNWLTCYFLEAYTTFKERIFSARNQTSGYLRYLKAEEVFGVNSTWNSDGTPIDAFIKGVIEDPGCWFTAAMSKPSDLPVCADASRSNAELSYQPAYTWSSKYGTTYAAAMIGSSLGLDGELDSNAIIAFQPSKLTMFISELNGWRAVHPQTGAEFSVDIADVLAAPSFDTTVDDGEICWLTTADGLDRVLGVCLVATSGANAEQFVPLTFKRHLDDSYSFGVPVLQFDADERPLGFTDNPESYMYGSDSFVNLPACDGFVLRLHTGYSMDPAEEVYDLDTSAAAQLGSLEMLPAIIGSTNGEAAVISDTNANRGFFPNLDDNIASINSGEGACLLKRGHHNTVVEVTTAAKGDSAATYNNIRYQLHAEVGFTGHDNPVSKLCQLSLYGYHRQTLVDYFTVLYTADGVGRAGTPGVTAYDLATSAVDPGRSLSPYSMYGWVARFMGAGSASKAMAAAAVAPADANMLTDWSYYYGTGVWESAYFGSGRVVPTTHENTVPDRSFNDITEMFVWANVSPSLTSFTGSVIYGYNGHAEDTAIAYGSDTTVVSTDGYIPVVAAETYRDFFNKYYPYSFYSPYSDAPYLLAGTGDFSFSNFVGAHQATRNPATRSHYYINDRRNYVADRPVQRLNRNWQLYGMTAPIFAERFLKGE